jgi:hypothetical protein
MEERWARTGGQALQGFGMAVAAGEDVDGDGVGDVLVGAPWEPDTAGVGVVHLFSGRTGEEIWRASGLGPNGGLGSAVAMGGDANGDGRPDVVVGAPLTPDGASQQVGQVLLLSGPDGEVLHSWMGEEEMGRFGASVDLGPDVNGDSLADVLVVAVPLTAAVPCSVSVFAGR